MRVCEHRIFRVVAGIKEFRRGAVFCNYRGVHGKELVPLPDRRAEVTLVPRGPAVLLHAGSPRYNTGPGRYISYPYGGHSRGSLEVDEPAGVAAYSSKSVSNPALLATA